MSISLSAYLKIITTEISQFPHYDTFLHFLLLGIAAYLSHLALNKRKIQILTISLLLAPIITNSKNIYDIRITASGGGQCPPYKYLYFF